MSDVVHYPHADAIALEAASPAKASPRPAYRAGCSCGWTATVTHSKRDAALVAAIAHARQANHPQELTP